MVANKKIRSTFCVQQDTSDCGIACLASVINYHEGSANFELLRKLSGTSRQGTTVLGLIEAARQVGLKAEGLEAESVDNLYELSELAILHVILENRLQHYFVFYGFENGEAIIGDPASGITRYTKENLNNVWKSKALIKLSPKKDFSKQKTISFEKKQWVIDLIRTDSNFLLIALLLGIITSALGLSTAIFTQKLIDNILPADNQYKLILSLTLVTLLLLIRSYLAFLRGSFIVQQSQNFNNRIISSFFRSLLRLPKSFFDTRKTGDLIARMNDTRRIQAVISSLSGNIVIDLLILTTSIVLIFMYSLTIGVFILISIPSYGILVWRFNKKIIQGQKEVMAGFALSESNYIDTIRGIETIKASNNELFFEKINKTIYGSFQEKSFALGQLGLRFGWSSEIIGIFFTMGTFIIASLMVFNKQLQIGELVATITMMGSAIPSLTRLAITNIQIQEAKVAFDRMHEFTSIKPEYEEHDEVSSAKRINSIQVEHISFRFPGRKQLLSDISLAIGKGEIIAILGESGSGKSTIIQILQKFYQVEGGKIIVDQMDINSIYTPSWRKQIGVVPQDVKIFNGSLIYNIVLSDSKELIQQAIIFCQSSGLSKFFESLPQGYLTIVGEDGVNLSGGQKQLVALARALWNKPAFLLLDEATSAMDKITERVILDLLLKQKKEMAILLVTHKMSTASLADRIYTIAKGTILNYVTPEELMLSQNLQHDS